MEAQSKLPNASDLHEPMRKSHTVPERDVKHGPCSAIQGGNGANYSEWNRGEPLWKTPDRIEQRSSSTLFRCKTLELLHHTIMFVYIIVLWIL